MAYYHNLREYLAALEQSGKLVRVTRPVNKDTELTPLVRLQYRGLPEEQRRTFLFENVIDSAGHRYAIPVAIAALAGSRQIYAIGMQCQPEEIASRFVKAQANPISPSLVSSGPVQEEVHLGDHLLEHGGLSEFPIPIATPGFDPAPYITAPCVITRDPDSSIGNVGMYRAMVKAPDRTGLNFYTAMQGGYIHYRKYQRRAQSMPAAIVIGGPPSISYLATTSLPVDVNELAVAGGIAGEPVEVVRCKTIDLEVPAHAEVVIEGLVPTDQLEPEAPFGETTGFVGPQDMNPFLRITCITHRRRPVWLAAISQYPPSESTKMRQFVGQATLLRHLRDELKMDYVLEIGFFEEVCSGPLTAIRMAGTSLEAVWRALEAAAKRYLPAKILVAVDEDVQVQDIASVLLAVVFRTQPHRDYRIESFPARSFGDYSLEPVDRLAGRQLSDSDRPTTSRLLIDATMKWPYPPVSLPKREFMDRAISIWQELGLPPLKLTPPWWGINLGYWNEEHERHALAATAGNHYLAGTEYARRREYHVEGQT
ncbi:MAG: UbiD family decarboxylase [Chloroflexota bacterium]